MASITITCHYLTPEDKAQYERIKAYVLQNRITMAVHQRGTYIILELSDEQGELDELTEYLHKEGYDTTA